MIPAQVTAREIRRRLMNPLNGRVSSDLEVISSVEMRRREAEAAAEQRQQEQLGTQHAIMARIDLVKFEITQKQEELSKLRMMLEVPQISVTEIVRAVCHVFGMHRGDILSDRRNATVVYPRHIAMYLSKLLTPHPLGTIGHRMGGKDHTTVLHAVNRIEDRMKDDIHLAADIDNIKWELGIR